MIRPACPDPETLAKFVDAGLRRAYMHPRQQLRIALHVELCPECEEAVAEVSAVVLIVDKDGSATQWGDK